MYFSLDPTNVSLLNDGSPTYLSASYKNYSNLDLSFSWYYGFMVFSEDKKVLKRKWNSMIDNLYIKSSSVNRFLGLNFQPDLNWRT